MGMENVGFAFVNWDYGVLLYIPHSFTTAFLGIEEDEWCSMFALDGVLVLDIKVL
jgi:hypothetical protein